MTPEAWFTVGVITLVIAALATNRIGVDIAMLGGLTVLMLGDAIAGGGILPVAEGLAGFAHPAIFIIGSLFVVAAGLQETGGMELVARRLLGRPKTIAGAQFRLMAPVALMSGFMNNTPIVAMYLPIVSDWAKKLRISPSKLYMPLSFAAILGGKISLIGTASNIVVMKLFVDFADGRLAAEAAGTATPWMTALGVDRFSSREEFWAIALVGIPTTITGIAVVLLFSRWLLPERRPATQTPLDARRYLVEMVVQPDSPIVGRTIEEAGLRHLPGLFLSQIERSGEIIPAVGPEERLQANDVLAFAGILESVLDLRKIRGLTPATDQVKKVRAVPQQRALVEAVVASTSPLVGRTIRESQFRTRFNAAILAVHRNGDVVRRRIGDIRLQSGDVLLLDTHAGFPEAHRSGSHFYLASAVEGSRPVRHERAWVALAILACLILALTLLSKTLPAVVTALLAAGLMVLTRCATGTIARASVSWQVLIVIASALGMGAAMSHTGAAQAIAGGMLDACSGFGPRGLLLVVFVLAAVFSQLITSYGSAVLMFPIAMSAAESLQVSPDSFALVLMVGAGSTYLTPIGYQTNLMVAGAGGYRFLDFTRLGFPLTIVVALTVIAFAPIFYPFVP